MDNQTTMNSSIADIRIEYKLSSLNDSEVLYNPMDQFGLWWKQAIESNIDEVNAMTLATVNAQGEPSARIVLLKGFDQNGFVFFTNYLSKKGKEIQENPKVSIVFFWKELQRQVCIKGKIEKTSQETSDEYFNSRPIGSRLGAWSSPQSQVIENREVIESNYENYQSKFGENVPRPEHWGGYLVVPYQIEFWQGRPSRMHDRILYTLEEDKWTIVRLAP